MDIKLSMKSHARLCCMLLTIPFIRPGLTSCQKEAEEDPPSIPDAQFLGILIRDGIDLNGNGEIDSQEASVPPSLDISNNNIRDLTGIELFTNLQSLDCNACNLSELDLSRQDS